MIELLEVGKNDPVITIMVVFFIMWVMIIFFWIREEERWTFIESDNMKTAKLTYDDLTKEGYKCDLVKGEHPGVMVRDYRSLE